jgi:hypothetical protein
MELRPRSTPRSAAAAIKQFEDRLALFAGCASYRSLGQRQSSPRHLLLNHIPGQYSLRGLYRSVFDDRSRKSVIAMANDDGSRLRVQAAHGDAHAALDMRRLKGALDYEHYRTTLSRPTPTRSAAASTAPSRPRSRASRLPSSKTPSAPQYTTRLASTTCSTAPSSSSVPREQFKAAARAVNLFLKERFFQALTGCAQM